MPAKKRTDGADIDLDILPSLIGYQLRLAQIAIFRDFAATFGDVDVTPGLFGVLVIIASNPGMTQNALARAAHLDRSTVVTVIDNLEKRNLVERRAAIPDRRANALMLTASGTRLLKRLKALVAEHEARLRCNLSTKDQATLVGLLQRIFPDLR